MNEQEEFFSSKHKRLLNIATWAKYLAWVVLVIFVFSAGVLIIQFQNSANFRASMNNLPAQSLNDQLTENPLNTFRLVTNMVASILRGIIYYLVLKGISLGLNMIVETDINYRDKSQRGGVQ